MNAVTGAEVNGTRKAAGEGPPECSGKPLHIFQNEKFINTTLSAIQRMRHAYLKDPNRFSECNKRLAESSERGNPPGALVYKCNPDGKFA